MTNTIQLISFYTLVRREFVRMLRIFSQVFLPPVVTTALYFLIFGRIIGSRIGDMSGVDYKVFITPGLIMMTVITNSYSNVSGSLFRSRFHKKVEQMIISPRHPLLFLLGYISGGVIRGLVVALLVYFVSCFF